MAIWNTAGPYDVTRSPPRSEQFAIVILPALIAAFPGVAVIWLMAADPVMPILCLASLASAAVAAVLAWVLRAELRTTQLNLWDIAGVYAFLGFGAGMLSKSDEILRLF